MANINELLDKSKKGFEKLDLPQKYKDSALFWLKKWLTEPDFKEYVPQIEYLINSEKWAFLLDAFYQVIPFGTGGRRGLVGIGTNRINTWTIEASAQGHSNYLIKQYGEDAKKRGVVLTYDVRVYTQKGIYDDNLSNPVMNLNCKTLAESAAKVYAANGIKVYMFDSVRSTPELSFSIRHLHAVSGAMFSASHNPPTDNGKKVYDEFGGQLIPPFDQDLVTEVTNNVKEIKTMDLNAAKSKGLVNVVGKEVDDAYINTVTSLSMSKNRKVKLAYSPLHGTGLTSTYPVLKKCGFDVSLDPKTSNLSGAFENVTFNIPNPEVEQSFDNMMSFANKIKADIIINSDPDADRIGIMVNCKGKWKHLNGNEISVILTSYGISKFKEKGFLNDKTSVIKTQVTSSLIAKICEKNKVECIGDLLVGFKYVAETMNGLEKKGRMKYFILAAEESHGFLMDNYARDKDSAPAAVWLCELAGELKDKKMTLIDYLDKIYSEYGYCHNYTTEIRLLGAKGMDQMAKIMNHLRDTDINSFGNFKVVEKVDSWKGKPHVSETDTVSRNVLMFKIQEAKGTDSIRVTIRPSGTEPKMKLYFEVFGKPFKMPSLKKEKEKISKIRDELHKYVMKYSYSILGVELPDRGFLLFSQLPLYDKVKYFEIEKDIVSLKKVKSKSERKEKALNLLKFLGSDPFDKINDAFKAEYKKNVQKYLGI